MMCDVRLFFLVCSVLRDLRDGKQKTILFIDELHTLVGAGAAEGAVDGMYIYIYICVCVHVCSACLWMVCVCMCMCAHGMCVHVIWMVWIFMCVCFELLFIFIISLEISQTHIP